MFRFFHRFLICCFQYRWTSISGKKESKRVDLSQQLWEVIPMEYIVDIVLVLLEFEQNCIYFFTSKHVPFVPYPIQSILRTHSQYRIRRWNTDVFDCTRHKCMHYTYRERSCHGGTANLYQGWIPYFYF